MTPSTGVTAVLAARVEALLRSVLALPSGLPLHQDTPLLGAMPALDSVAVAALLTELEDALGFVVNDELLSAEAFATVGTLCEWVANQLPASSP